MPVSPMDVAIRYPAVPRTRTPPMMNFVRARTTATPRRFAPDSRSLRLVQRRASHPRHDGIQLFFGLGPLFRGPEVDVLVGVAQAEMYLVNELAERGVAAAFQVGLDGRFAHEETGKR